MEWKIQQQVLVSGMHIAHGLIHTGSIAMFLIGGGDQTIVHMQ